MKKQYKMPVRFFWVLVGLIILQACHPYPDSVPITDLDTTTTIYNSDDLATAPTSAAIVWEVLHIESGDDSDLPYDGGADDEILNSTLDELVILYGQDSVVIISETATPPLYNPATYPGVRIIVPNVDPVPYIEAVYAPSVLLREKTVVIAYPGYGWWGGWYGGYWPGYGGCYYCGYPSYGYVTYEVGTVLLEMSDLRQISPTGIIPDDYDYSWVAIMRGLLGSTVGTQERVVSGIHKAFEQSKIYLQP